MVTEEYEYSMTLALISFLLEEVEVLVCLRSWASLTFHLPVTPSSLDIKKWPISSTKQKDGPEEVQLRDGFLFFFLLFLFGIMMGFFSQ